LLRGPASGRFAGQSWVSLEAGESVVTDQFFAVATIVLAIALAVPAMATQVQVSSSASSTVDIPLDRAPASNEGIMLRVSVNPEALAQGSRITLSSATDGKVIGNITPFGRTRADRPARFDVLVPKGVLRADERGKMLLPLRIELHPGEAGRGVAQPVASVEIEPEIVPTKN
jgi:hypothetical protein